MASASGSRRSAGGFAPHAAHPPVRRSHAAQSARRQDLVLHSFLGRGSRVGGVGHGAASRRHAVSRVSQPGAANRPRHFAGRSHVPVSVEHPGHVQGTSAAGDVPLQARQYVFHLRQSGHAVSAGRGLGDGGGDQGRRSIWRPPGSARAAAPKRIFIMPCCLPRCIRRPSF